MVHSCLGSMVVWTPFACGYAIAWLPAGVNFDQGAPYQSREWPRPSLHLPDREVLNYLTRTHW
ncbi:MAG: hypothetical protein F6K63_34020 [Moorea sp. SIO1G6]|uniref:hypothetical protein n=1 Tax=Moorena sp. SIO1G6 TaxID=2607840 RepID=UPI0013C0F372|nr:hypothetical protein [Moorena sp. SIO1G6]NET69149.1 hypothetical protein [Moorena sp. SIO1G6]